MFFFNDTATTEIYTLSLHDALPILAIATQEELVDKMVSNMKEVTARGAEVFAFTTEGHTQMEEVSVGITYLPKEIGRASCRERGVDLGGRRIIKKKKCIDTGLRSHQH